LTEAALSRDELGFERCARKERTRGWGARENLFSLNAGHVKSPDPSSFHGSFRTIYEQSLIRRRDERTDCVNCTMLVRNFILRTHRHIPAKWTPYREVVHLGVGLKPSSFKAHQPPLGIIFKLGYCLIIVTYMNDCMFFVLPYQTILNIRSIAARVFHGPCFTPAARL
jgi:hypothetical protein